MPVLKKSKQEKKDNKNSNKINESESDKESTYMWLRRHTQEEIAPKVAHALYNDFNKKCKELKYPEKCLSVDEIKKFLGVASYVLRSAMDPMNPSLSFYSNKNFILDQILEIPKFVNLLIKDFKNVENAPKMDFKKLCSKICNKHVESALQCTDSKDEYKILEPRHVYYILHTETMITIIKARSGLTFTFDDVQQYLSYFPYFNLSAERNLQIIMETIKTHASNTFKYLIKHDATSYWEKIIGEENRKKREEEMKIKKAELEEERKIREVKMEEERKIREAEWEANNKVEEKE